MLTTILATLSLFASHALAIQTIYAKGSKFFTEDGAQFYIKGIAYQLTNDDPLVDTAQCQLDATLMQTLGTNAIRVYHVDAGANHDGCMTAFANAGIYTLIDLDTFDTYIVPPPGSTPEWTERQYSAFQAVMDTFQSYDNVLAFFVGNEMLTTAATSAAAPYIKAAARDMKAYRDSKGYRPIPVGYSAADIASLRPNLQNYLACGGNTSEAIDFYSLNAYEWCGDSSYETSGYSQLEQNATDYPLPIFFSEDGCNQPEPRTFTDQAAIFGSEMEDTWSGAIIYEWIQVNNDYGLIQYGNPGASNEQASDVFDGFTVAGTPTPILPDFTDLSSQWATLSPTGVSANAYTPSNPVPVCPPYTAGVWEVSGNVVLPTLGQVFDGSQATQASDTVSGTTTYPSGSSATSASSSKNSKSAAAPGPVATDGKTVITAASVAIAAVFALAVGL